MSFGDDTLHPDVEQDRRKEAELKNLRQIRDAVIALLPLISEYAPQDFPPPTHEGSCGPWSNCDGNCVDIAHMAEHNAAVWRLRRLVEEKV